MMLRAPRCRNVKIWPEQLASSSEDARLVLVGHKVIDMRAKGSERASSAAPPRD